MAVNCFICELCVQILSHTNSTALPRTFQLGTCYWISASTNSQTPVTVEFPSQRPVTRSLEFSLICAWANGWENNRNADDFSSSGAIKHRLNWMWCFEWRRHCLNMMTSSNGNIFRVTGPLCGEFTGPRWIPRTKASDAELWCFLWSAYAEER